MILSKKRGVIIKRVVRGRKVIRQVCNSGVGILRLMELEQNKKYNGHKNNYLKIIRNLAYKF
tara:strand:+ start:15026 stop:15211 length:186 start_codon:yes stop_codon:yes gene_type:complete